MSSSDAKKAIARNNEMVYLRINFNQSGTDAMPYRHFVDITGQMICAVDGNQKIQSSDFIDNLLHRPEKDSNRTYTKKRLVFSKFSKSFIEGLYAEFDCKQVQLFDYLIMLKNSLHAATAGKNIKDVCIDMLT